MIRIEWVNGAVTMSAARSMRTVYVATGEMRTHPRCHIAQPVPATRAYLVLGKHVIYDWALIRSAIMVIDG